MEKRLVMAIVLSFVILVGYQLLFVKAKPPQPPMAATETWQAKPDLPAQPPAPAGPQAEKESAAPAPESLKPTAAEGEVEIPVDTSLYQAVWSNRGGVLKSWRIKQHKDEKGDPLELVSSRSRDVGRYPFSLRTEDPSLAEAVNGALFQVSGASLEVRDGETREIRFIYSDGKGLQAEKTFLFKGGTYEMSLEIKVSKDGRPVDPAVIWGPGLGNPAPADQKQRFSATSGMAVYSGGRVFRMDEKKYKPETSAYNFVSWAAYEDNYFTALFVSPPENGTSVFVRDAREASADYYLAVSGPHSAFIGPKEFDRLRQFGHEAKKVINFGFFGAIAEILLISGKYFYRAIPNWGVAIIILTAIIKIIFFPLTYSSTRSMAKMAELQPKIKALRAKYKKSKTDIAQRRQMNEEMMKMYKEHGVNPAGGCLPMLIQIPVFWGFFRMLVVAVEFRHSPFLLWIKDLSVRDPYYVTPILMGATQFISQKMTPTSADPAQAKMMLIMPVVMTVFFMNFQSGLVLYWLINNVLQIAQQAVMNRMIARKKREADGKRR